MGKTYDALIGIYKHMIKKDTVPALKKLIKGQPYYCCTYKVRGTNPKTGRKKTEKVIEASNAPNERIGERSGLLPPYEIENADVPMTKDQSDSLIYHDFCPLDTFTLQDASIFITRGVDGEDYFQEVAPISFTDFAIENGIYISRFASKKEAKDILLNYLPEKAKEIKALK